MIIKIILIGFVANIFFGSNCSSQEIDSHKVNQLADSDTTSLAIDFQAINLMGQTFNANSLKGKSVLIDFWAVWCGPCIAAFPTLKKLNQDLKKENFEVVGVAVYSGSHQDVRPFVEKYNLDYKVVVGDGNLAERFGVIGFPTYFLIGPDGNVHKQYVGEAKSLYSDMKKEVAKLNKSKAR